jgi:hypothetical protein
MGMNRGRNNGRRGRGRRRWGGGGWAGGGEVGSRTGQHAIYCIIVTLIHSYTVMMSFLGLPRQPSYTTGFGTALNIETLVAAAEQRDIPIEVGFVLLFWGNT